MCVRRIYYDTEQMHRLIEESIQTPFLIHKSPLGRRVEEFLPPTKLRRTQKKLRESLDETNGLTQKWVNKSVLTL